MKPLSPALKHFAQSQEPPGPKNLYRLHALQYARHHQLDLSFRLPDRHIMLHQRFNIILTQSKSFCSSILPERNMMSLCFLPVGYLYEFQSMIYPSASHRPLSPLGPSVAGLVAGWLLALVMSSVTVSL